MVQSSGRSIYVCVCVAVCLINCGFLKTVFSVDGSGEREITPRKE